MASIFNLTTRGQHPTFLDDRVVDFEEINANLVESVLQTDIDNLALIKNMPLSLIKVLLTASFCN